MATIIYHDIEKSKYIFIYDHLTFYFSAPLYLSKFKERYIDYIKIETSKFNSRFRMNIFADELLLLELYRKIEKRGFKVLYDNEDIEEFCSINFLIDKENSIKREG